MTRIDIVPAYRFREEVRELFREYMDMLVEKDSTLKDYAFIKNYSQEVDSIDEKYAMPDGRIYIAFAGDRAAGCAALRKIDESTCELKRVYVRDEFRGKKVGRQLVEKITDEAVAIGYSRIMLDTLPFLKKAIDMYLGMGFEITERYNETPIENTVFMQKYLQKSSE